MQRESPATADRSKQAGRAAQRAMRTLRAIPWELLASLGVLGAAWHLASRAVGNPVLLPSPDLVLRSLWQLLEGDLLADIAASLRHLSIGYFIGASTGFLLALLAAASRLAGALLDPIIELLRPISGIAWIPIAIALLGIGEAVPTFLIAYVAVFPIFLNTLAGIQAVDRRLIAAAEVLGAGRAMIYMRIILPAALPMILAGVRLSLGVSWMTLIAAELVGGDSGLGWRSFWYEQFFSTHKTMAIVLTVGVLGYLLDSCVRLLQRSATAWSRELLEMR
jgi:ABC-type nitrate/sulfonate/bicarbonate transport system permease component